MHNELILGLCHDIWDEATTPLASMLRTGETEANCPVVLREPVRARRDNRATYNSGACRAHLVRHCLWKLILVAPSQEPFMRRFIADAAAAAELEDAASPPPSPPPTPPPLELSLRLTGASDDDFFLDANGTWPPCCSARSARRRRRRRRRGSEQGGGPREEQRRPEPCRVSVERSESVRRV